MKTCAMKRVLKFAMRHDCVRIRYSSLEHDSWEYSAKLTAFNIYRPKYAVGKDYYRIATIEFIFDNEYIFWADNLNDFSQKHIGFEGIGDEGQEVSLKFLQCYR